MDAEKSILLDTCLSPHGVNKISEINGVFEDCGQVQGSNITFITSVLPKTIAISACHDPALTGGIIHQFVQQQK